MTIYKQWYMYWNMAPKNPRKMGSEAPVHKRKKKPEVDELWKEFLGPDSPYYFEPLGVSMTNVHCGLCGNTGIVDTRGKVMTPNGMPCGVRRYCICPCGRLLKKDNSDALVPPEVS